MKNFYIYILTNVYNTTLYIGVTNNLERRIYEHKNELLEGFSKKYKLHKLVYFECTGDSKSAIAREKQLKGLTRAKKEELIYLANPTWRDLSDDFYK